MLNRAPEVFKKNIRTTQKIDIYSLGVTFYIIITHENPIQASSYEQFQIMMAQMKFIDRPSIIKDDLLWDFLSKLLEFDPNKRLSADEALLHPYLTGSEASADISDNQMELASLAIEAEKNGDKNITEFDKNQLYIIAENEINS
ncbi:MAG: hypothetical protein EZS28_051001 [Streblomastix strix]|uniref:Protein kinase domain-containing protein n=1 Tax=Streblomastix strix TaxID=222440 RepID=A0A5J4T663_9EUKA|nr:MAG: hypothetical protein EZS28_051001 [Streblomastix strix]